MAFPCNYCNLVFARRYNRDRHSARNHGNDGQVGGQLRLYNCIICGLEFPSIAQLHQHINATHAPDFEYQRVQQLYRASCVVYRMHYVPPVASLEATVLQDMDSVIRVMTHEVARQRIVKFSMVTTAEFVKVENDEIVDAVTHYLRSPNYVLTQYQDHADIFMMSYQHIKTGVEDFVVS
jgi:Zinc finger, C2H2 type